MCVPGFALLGINAPALGLGLQLRLGAGDSSGGESSGAEAQCCKTECPTRIPRDHWVFSHPQSDLQTDALPREFLSR